MTDDLVKRLRDRGASDINCLCGNPVCVESADRIETLEDDLHHCFHRVEELQAALREIAYTEPEDKYWPGRIARKALEGKDE